jgi:hypothetical protein
MRISRSWSKLSCAAALASLGIVSAGSVTAACSVWWQQKCCAKAGITGIVCGTFPNQWRCAHNLVSDPTVGSITAADAGWNGPWLATFDTCTYNAAACGFTPGTCIYQLPASNANCTDVVPPSTPPNCDMCP